MLCGECYVYRDRLSLVAYNAYNSDHTGHTLGSIFFGLLYFKHTTNISALCERDELGLMACTSAKKCWNTHMREL